MKINKKCKISEEDLFYRKNQGILYRIRRWFFNKFQRKKCLKKRYERIANNFHDRILKQPKKQTLFEKIIKELEKNAGKK